MLTMTDVHPNVQLIRDYLGALQSGEAGQALARFFTRDALQRELPNRLNPKGQESDLSSLLARSEHGKHVLSSQKYEILSEIAQGERVAFEALWTGILAIPIGSLPAGSEMRAHFGMFFECQNGRIRRQHNYDCFESW